MRASRAALSALLALVTAARSASAQSRPAPLDSIVPPSPAPNGFVSDGGPVLDAAALAAINTRIAEVQRTTGGDVAVAILRDLHDRAPVDVGVAIYRAWKIGRVDSLGSSRRNLGALLLIVPKELAPSHRGECWIATGTGAEGELTDARSAAICRDSIIPHLKTKDYPGAVQAGVEGIAAAFVETTANESAPPVPVAESSHGGSGGRIALGGGAALVALLSAVTGALRYRRRKPRLCPSGHGPMVRLDEVADDDALLPGQRVEERIGSIDYDVWACTTCSERLVIPYKHWFTSFHGCPSCNFRTVSEQVTTLRHATTSRGGLEEVTRTCENCGWRDVTRRSTPRISTSSSSSGGSSSSSGGGSSFGGSGSTSGGGGGSSY